MTNLPKTALLIDRTVVDEMVYELATNKKATKFWIWTGRYIQRSRGPQRLPETVREITFEEAQKELEKIERINDEWDAFHATEEPVDEEPIEEPVDDSQMTLF